MSQPFDVSKVQLASRQHKTVGGHIDLEFSIARNDFKEKFLRLPNTNNIILGKLFFKNNSIEFYPKENLLKIPDLTLQSNEILTQMHKIGNPNTLSGKMRH